MLDSLFILCYNSIEVEEILKGFEKRLSKQNFMLIKVNEYYFIRKSRAFNNSYMVLDSKGYLIDWLQEKIVWQVFLGIDLEEWE
jgi:hypothetical protein